MAMTHHETITAIVNRRYTDDATELNAVVHSWEIPFGMFEEAGLDVSAVEIGATVIYVTNNSQGEPLKPVHFKLTGLEKRAEDGIGSY